MMDSGPVREPPRPETPKLCVPILRSFAKVRKVSCTNTLPALSCSAICWPCVLGAGNHRGGESELGVVGQCDGLSVVLKRITGRMGPKVSSRIRRMRVVHFGDHGGPHVQAAPQ